MLPKHIAIIMDGNGRWAQLRGRPRTFGHIKGARVAKKIITACAQQGIENLTLYAFSSENWLRPVSEVSFLMTLLRRYLKKEAANLVKENIQFTVIGEIEKLPSDVIEAIQFVKKSTEQNTGMKLTFAISYGSRNEILDAVKKIAAKVKFQEMDIQQINEDVFSKHLQTKDTPDPDLIIRTSGENRLSNFLMWQAAYSEFYFTDILWPDFTEQDLNLALIDFQKRERRFGAVDTHEVTHY
jgi:undecaprenyl diphosphate synthase